MQWKKVLIAIIVGIILWMSDILYGWMSVNISGIWTIFIVMFIVGIISGDISGGFVAAFLTELLSILLLVLFPQILVPGATITASDLFGMMWLVMGLSLSYSLRFPDEPVPWIEGLVIIALLIILAPFVYAMALFFGLLGGIFGRFIHPRVFKPKGASTPIPSQQPQQAPPPPQPPAPDEVQDLEAAEEEIEESSRIDLEPSE
ncbi:MAG: hypothetical protein ACFFF9_08220 [Candidatus Thorarchaeota archaeon]